MGFRDIEESIRALQKKFGELLVSISTGLLSVSGNMTVGGDITANRIRLTNTGDASAGSTGHAFQVGDTSGPNVIIDNNEIMYRNNGTIGNLYIEGGIGTGGSGSTPNGIGLSLSDSRINGTHYPYAVAAGTVSMGSSLSNGSGTEVTVTFPANRFSVAPIVTVSPAGSARLQAAIVSTSASSVTVGIDNHSGANASGIQPLRWQAMQMTSGSASG